MAALVPSTLTKHTQTVISTTWSLLSVMSTTKGGNHRFDHHICFNTSRPMDNSKRNRTGKLFRKKRLFPSHSDKQVTTDSPNKAAPSSFYFLGFPQKFVSQNFRLVIRRQPSLWQPLPRDFFFGGSGYPFPICRLTMTTVMRILKDVEVFL